MNNKTNSAQWQGRLAAEGHLVLHGREPNVPKALDATFKFSQQTKTMIELFVLLFASFLGLLLFGFAIAMCWSMIQILPILILLGIAKLFGFFDD